MDQVPAMRNHAVPSRTARQSECLHIVQSPYADQSRARFASLFDGGIYTEVEVPEPVLDPLQFRDQKRYPDRMKTAQKTTGEAEAMLVGEGEMGRTPIIAAAQDFSFMGGSMGMYVGNAIIAAATRAVARKRPRSCFLPLAVRGCRKASSA